MEITTEPEPTIWTLLGGIIVFSAMAIAALYFAIIVLLQLLSDLSNQRALITFDKGSFYLYGVGLCLLAVVFSIIYSKILKKEMTRSANVIFTWLFVGSLILTFALPQIVHTSMDSYMENNNYQICEDKSHRWLHAVTIVYGKNSACNDK